MDVHLVLLLMCNNSCTVVGSKSFFEKWKFILAVESWSLNSFENWNSFNIFTQILLQDFLSVILIWFCLNYLQWFN